MKPAALESKKEISIAAIEAMVDELLKHEGKTFDKETAPVRKPEARQLIALERIEEKLKVLNGEVPAPEVKAQEPEPAPEADEATIEDTATKKPTKKK